MLGSGFKIVCFTGKFGSGKTATCSYFATEVRSALGCRLWSNYGLAGSLEVRTIADLYDCTDGVIVLDEIQGTVHSRQGMTKKNMEFLTWFDQVRKQGSLLFIISQELSKVDRIVRDMLDYEVNCRNIGGGYSELNTYALVDGEPARRVSSTVFDMRVAFGLYDTRQRAWGLEPTASDAAAGGSRAKAALRSS